MPLVVKRVADSPRSKPRLDEVSSKQTVCVLEEQCARIWSDDNSSSRLQGEGNGIDNARPCPGAGGNDACSSSRVSQGQGRRYTVRVCRSRRASRRQRRPGTTADQVLTTGVCSARRSFFWTGVFCVFGRNPLGNPPRQKGGSFSPRHIRADDSHLRELAAREQPPICRYGTANLRAVVHRLSGIHEPQVTRIQGVAADSSLSQQILQTILSSTLAFLRLISNGMCA